jgi:hypothetical protein
MKQALPQKRCIKGVVFFVPEISGHKRVPSKQFYYWGSDSLMGYHFEKLFGSCFWNKDSTRKLIVWGNFHFEDSRWMGSARYTSYNKSKVGLRLDKRSLKLYKEHNTTRRGLDQHERFFVLGPIFFLLRKKTFHNRVPPPSVPGDWIIKKNTIEFHPTNRYTTLHDNFPGDVPSTKLLFFWWGLVRFRREKLAAEMPTL